MQELFCQGSSAPPPRLLLCREREDAVLPLTMGIPYHRGKIFANIFMCMKDIYKYQYL
jgi:hypothetical protein